MRLVRYRHGGRAQAGVVEGDAVRPCGDDVLAPAPSPGGRAAALADVELLAPIQPVRKIVCVGLNYKEHAQESGQDLPERPLLFAKFANTVVGPGQPISIPPVTEQADYEAELGVVIGRRARRVAVEDALLHVYGYTCVNDVSARDLQMSDGQWVRGKSLDTFCPVGPWIVTSDEVPDPQALPVRCVVNGAVMQDSTTADMVFPVAELVSFISQSITLEPGDLIATGTPAGVGFTRTPPVFLRPGDAVRVEIDGVGVLENPVVAG